MHGGWSDGQLAQKGDILAGTDVVAELEALLSEVDLGSEVQQASQTFCVQPDKHAANHADEDLIIDDVDDLDLELATGGKAIQSALQAQLAAFDEAFAGETDDD